jgi:hypothetical protein
MGLGPRLTAQSGMSAHLHGLRTDMAGLGLGARLTALSGMSVHLHALRTDLAGWGWERVSRHRVA